MKEKILIALFVAAVVTGCQSGKTPDAAAKASVKAAEEAQTETSQCEQCPQVKIDNQLNKELEATSKGGEEIDHEINGVHTAHQALQKAAEISNPNVKLLNNQQQQQLKGKGGNTLNNQQKDLMKELK